MKEEFYEYGQQLGIKINDLQRLRSKFNITPIDQRTYTKEELIKAMIEAFDAGFECCRDNTYTWGELNYDGFKEDRVDWIKTIEVGKG
jgi:hypothetical protein